MDPQLYRAKPVVVEAMQFTGDDVHAVAKWCGARLFPRFEMGLDIVTPEGIKRAHYGDWIIKGDNGQLSKCIPDVFEATYEKVEDVIEPQETFWNGMLFPAAKGTAVIADAPEFPQYWAKKEGLIGLIIPVVQVVLGDNAEDETWYMDNRDGSAWFKVTAGHGSPRYAHKNVAIEPGSFKIEQPNQTEE